MKSQLKIISETTDDLYPWISDLERIQGVLVPSGV